MGKGDVSGKMRRSKRQTKKKERGKRQLAAALDRKPEALKRAAAPKRIKKDTAE